MKLWPSTFDVQPSTSPTFSLVEAIMKFLVWLDLQIMHYRGMKTFFRSSVFLVAILLPSLMAASLLKAQTPGDNPQVITTTNPTDQTPTLSGVYTSGLAYSISLQTVDMGGQSPAGLQSYAVGSYDGEYVFFDGRENGLHNFNNSGINNFPPQYQNTDILVLDPVTKQTWTRTITNSGLSQSEISSLSATAPEFSQQNNTLYVAGGYLYDSASNNFITYSTLTALDLPGVVDWVKTGTSNLSASMRQTTNSTLQVTGGDLHIATNGTALLTFGQNFEGPYTPGANGTYTKQVRSFSIVDGGSGGTLSISNISASPVDDAYRRRDLNVVPLAQTGSNGPSLVALSGVFTTNGGMWTVPVEIGMDGSNVITSMADPTASNTFKQAMNNYHSPTISLYSPTLQQNQTVILGGISEGIFSNSVLTEDQGYGWTSQSSVVVRDAAGNYEQYYLGDVFPNINFPGTNTPALFGGSAEFLANTNLPMIDGVINMDTLTNGTTLGYVFGGIQSMLQETTNSTTDTTVSPYLFQVIYSVPEPSTYILLLLGGLVLLAAAHRHSLKR